MDIIYKVGQSVIEELFEYTERNSLDDQSEFFPILKTCIKAVAKECQDEEQRVHLEKQLKQYARSQYCNLWLYYAKESEEKVSIEQEKNEANHMFEKFYENALKNGRV